MRRGLAVFVAGTFGLGGCTEIARIHDIELLSTRVAMAS